MPQGFPLTPSTGVMVSNACSQTNKDDFQEDRTRMLCNVECSTQKYEFGKSMHEYAKKLEKRGNANTKTCHHRKVMVICVINSTMQIMFLIVKATTSNTIRSIIHTINTNTNNVVQDSDHRTEVDSKVTLVR